VINLFFYRYNRLIKKIEKKYKFSLFFLSIFRVSLIVIEKIFFKKLKSDQFLNYSNYYLDERYLSNNNNIISAGIADDISFEKELIKNIKIDKMVCIDPTKTSELIMNEIISDNIIFIKSAIYGEEKLTKIYLPFDRSNLNLSIDNIYNSNNFELIKTITVKKIMENFELDKIDILKLDVEGVSDSVIKSLIDNNIFPKQIAFEIERPISFLRQYKFFKRLFYQINLLKKNYNLYSHTKSKLGFRIEILATLKD